MSMQDVRRLRDAHGVVAEVPFEVVPVTKGYADRVVRIDISSNEIKFLPVTQQMKDLWVGGKGFDLWLMFQEVTRNTRWDSPENPICMSPGPLAGTTSFPGSGKTLVTSLSPITGSVMDCNVGGFFGPLFKFCGFDALVLVGRAPEETVVVIDAVRGRITIERAPLESVDGHLAAEELTEMYAEDELDKRNISVVCAGRGAEHTRMGVLNFSFYDWRKRTARIKQAGRGGIGTVFRHKKMKALIVRNRGINPAWSVAENKVARFVTPKTISEVRDPADRQAISGVIDKYNRDPECVIDMLRDVQARFGHVPRTALDEITRATCTPTAYLYHMVTFLGGLRLEPSGAAVVQVCTGATCHALGAGQVLAAFERELGIRAGETTPDGRHTLLAGPCLGACSAAPVVRVGDAYYGNVRPGDAQALLRAHATGGDARPAAGGATRPAAGGQPGARPLTPEELAAVAEEQKAYQARSRALLAICTGNRTPAGSAGAKAGQGEAASAASAGKPAGTKDAGVATVLAGCIERPGPVTVAPGTTLRTIIDALGGGMRAGRAFKAAHAGGPSGWFLNSAALDRPLDLPALTPTGAMTGPDRLIILDESACLVAAARHAAEFLMSHSCGKCTPCREGLHAAAQALTRLCTGAGRPDDLALIDEVCQTARAASACQFGVQAPNPLLSAIESFREEFEEHARGRCRAGVCTGGTR
jgi:NADH:ubiquinone oxidoreductase subunit E